VPNNTAGMWEDFFKGELLGYPEQLLSSVLSAPNVGVAICDEQLHFQGINGALAAMNGVRIEAHLGKPLNEILGGVAEEVGAHFRRALAKSAPVLNLEICGKLPARTEVGHWVENYFPVKDSSGKVSRVFAVVLEVTREKQLEEVLNSLTHGCQQAEDRLKTLLEINSTLAAQRDLQEFFPWIEALVKAIVPYAHATIALHDERAHLLSMYPLRSSQVRERSASTFAVPVQETPFGPALLGREPEVFSRRDLEGFHSPFVRRILESEVQSLCCIPVVSQRGTVGVLNLASSREKAFPSATVELLERVAAQVAITLDHAWVYNEIVLLKNQLLKKKISVDDDADAGTEAEIVGESDALKQALSQVKIVAASDATVLILGEPGTGKDLLASTVHGLSRRSNQPFVKARCATLLESELLGDDKQTGLLELATNGTLFLDEVADLSPELQLALLRVIEDESFERPGSGQKGLVNVRFVASTSRDLARKVAESQFHRDLYYRLNVFPVRIAPLRERREDIPPLAHHFVQAFARRMNRALPVIPDETMNALLKWSWPGNVSELENFLERAVILTRGTVLQAPVAELVKKP
jgi:formate hydrogenlyase transcriptional activator